MFTRHAAIIIGIVAGILSVVPMSVGFIFIALNFGSWGGIGDSDRYWTSVSLLFLIPVAVLGLALWVASVGRKREQGVIPSAFASMFILYFVVWVTWLVANPLKR